MTHGECRKVALLITHTIRMCGRGTHKRDVYSAVVGSVDRAVVAGELAAETGELAIALTSLAMLETPRGA